MPRLYDWLNDQIRNPKIFGSRLNDEFNQLAWTNVPTSVSGAYVVANTDRAGTLILDGSASYTVTFNAATTYDTNFAVLLYNADGDASKKIVADGQTTFLWPYQSKLVSRQGSVWALTPKLELWVPTVTTLWWDPVSGVNATNDGIASSRPMLTLGAAVLRANTLFDLNSTQLIFRMTPSGSTDTVQAHISVHSTIGTQGGAALLIDGDSGTMSVAGTALQLYFPGARFQCRRMKFASAGGSCIEVNYQAYLELLDAIEFGSSASSDISIGDGGYLYFGQNYNISGTKGNFHISNIGGTVKATAICTPFIKNNITVNTFAFGQTPGTTDLSLAAYDTATFGTAVTGKKFNMVSNHAGFGAANIPGSVAGTFSGGGSMDGVAAL